MKNLLYKPDAGRAATYWRAFWEKEVIDRPLICVTAPRRGMTVPAYDGSASVMCRRIMRGDFAPIIDEYERYASSIAYLGESFPSLDLTLGPDEYAAFLGAELTVPEVSGTTWTTPRIDDWSGYSACIDKSSGGCFDQLRRCFEYAAGRSDGRFLLNMLDLHSAMDALSALRGPQDLCLDIYDCPEELHRVLDEVRATYGEIYSMPYEAGDMANRGTIGWAPLYCEDRFAVVQCDFSCMISPRQVREFVIPAVEEESAYLDHCLYHYDGEGALGHLDDILALPKIDAIQWVPGDGRPRSIEWMDLLHKIQSAGKGLWIYDWSPDEIRTHFRELRPEGLVFSVSAPSEDEAERLLEDVRRLM